MHITDLESAMPNALVQKIRIRNHLKTTLATSVMVFSVTQAKSECHHHSFHLVQTGEGVGEGESQLSSGFTSLAFGLQIRLTSHLTIHDTIRSSQTVSQNTLTYSPSLPPSLL